MEREAIEVPGYAFWRKTGIDEFTIYVMNASGTYLPHDSRATQEAAMTLSRKLDARHERMIAQRQHRQGTPNG